MTRFSGFWTSRQRFGFGALCSLSWFGSTEFGLGSFDSLRILSSSFLSNKCDARAAPAAACPVESNSLSSVNRSQGAQVLPHFATLDLECSGRSSQILKCFMICQCEQTIWKLCWWSSSGVNHGKFEILRKENIDLQDKWELKQWHLYALTWVNSMKSTLVRSIYLYCILRSVLKHYFKEETKLEIVKL